MQEIHKTYSIAASQAKVYAALTEPTQIERWTGAPASMDLTVGGAFSLWNGDILGVNRFVSPDRLEQDWKVAAWDAYSVCVLVLREVGAQTEVELFHRQVPESAIASIRQGWDEYYFGPLKALLEAGE